MPDERLTRLRVAQAARTPVTVEEVVDLLAGDEMAHSLSASKTQTVLDEHVRAGLLDELPARGEQSVRYVQAGVFRDDLERRIVGNLREPTSLTALVRRLDDDPHAPNDGEQGTLSALTVLQARGLVVNLGAHEKASEIIRAHVEHDLTPALPREHRTTLQSYLGHPDRQWRLRGEHWAMTSVALDALEI